jgi:molybdenum cofactor cytidylyltransferase
MGEPKLLLPWKESTVIGHLLAVWRSVGADQIAVVCAARPHPLQGELDRLGFPETSRILNGSPELGMFSSIRCAAGWPGWEGNLTHFVVLLGDQPQIRLATLKALVTHAGAHPECICQPALHGRPKHPLVFPAAVFRQLARSEATTLREFLQTSGLPRSFMETEDESLAIDLDTPADYAKARLAHGA